MLIINLLILIFMPFLMLGIIKKTKAFWGGRKGPSILQPLFDFIKLIKKGLVISNTTTSIFNIAPAIALGVSIFASLFVPFLGYSAIIDIPFGLIVFSYILGFGKFISIISALDTGSSFEGMGSSREACFTTIIEPAFFIVIASIMALCKIYTFDSLNQIIHSSGSIGYLIIIFAILALLIMLIVEGARVPVDDPATHLELTMIHEVMVLDNGGVDLALINWASAIKMFLFASLITNLVLPNVGNLNLGILIFVFVSSTNSW